MISPPTVTSTQDGQRRAQREITCGITAFLRPDSLGRLVASIRRYYPSIQILVADNGDRPATLPTGSKLIYQRLPFDCGLSAARNWLVDHLRTPYLLVLEDDFEFTEATRLDQYLDVLDADGQIGCVGGALVERHGMRELALDLDLFRGQIRTSYAPGPWARTSAGTAYRLCDMVYNNFLARRQFLLDHRWNEQLKLREHVDFFLRVQSARMWRVAYTPEVSLRHHHERPNGRYQNFRDRARHDDSFKRLILKRWGACDWQLLPSRPVTRPGDRPNIVLLGVGHSGTSIVTRMVEALGWSLPNADEKFAEHVAVRRLNDEALRSGVLDDQAARRLVRQLPEPWIIKDPRFVVTLPYWLGAFAPAEPLLVWLVRQTDSVEKSYRRRGQKNTRVVRTRGLTIPQASAACQRHYRDWPWAKIRIDYEHLRKAVAMFDLERGA